MSVIHEGSVLLSENPLVPIVPHELSDRDLKLWQSVLRRTLREAKFWLLVERGDPEACWEWRGFRDRQGYGQFERATKAYRQAYEYVVGPVPSGMVVCHTCDNPPCCNPAHLFIGTKKDNSQDMAAKGRAPRAKLTPVDVVQIRRAVLAGAIQRRLAEKYGVTPKTINAIVRGRSHQKRGDAL